MRPILALAAALTAAPVLAAQDQPMLVSVDWLAERINDPKLVVLQVGDDRSRPVYDAGHIPGSRFLHPWQTLSTPRVEGQLNLELPAADVLARSLEQLGISNDSRVVLVMASQYVTPTTRSYLTLVYAGLGGRVSILDGGLEAWQAAGHPVTTEVPAVQPGRFVPKLDRSVVTTVDYVATHRTDPAVRIVDARSPNFYDGAETRQGRNGHITGAVNVPYSIVAGEDGRFKTVEELRALFAAAGVAPGQQVVTYCHIGQQATAVWFAARLAGFDATMYDGSFQEWAARTDLPVTTPD